MGYHTGTDNTNSNLFQKKFLLIFHNQPPAPPFLLRKFRPLSPYLEAGIWHSKLMISDLANFTKMFILNLLYYTIYPGSKTPYGFDFFLYKPAICRGFLINQPGI